MGARWLYMLPALLLSALAVILALIGLARHPDSSGKSAPGVVMQVTEDKVPDALKHSYWVATHELNIGTVIQKDDFRRVGVSVPLAQAVPADTPVEGELLRRNVREGEILAKTHLEAGNRLAQNVPAGFRAIAINIDNVSSIGGLLQPGDLVDVLASFRNGEDKKPTAMILLSSIEVLAVKGRIEDAPENTADDQQTRGRNATAVLAVPREDLVRLLVADANGQVRLAMAGAAQQHGQGEGPTPVAAGKDNSMTTKLEDLFPHRAVRSSAPSRGDKVEVFEGSTSRSTYVH
ncbi:MAG: Flp pilus assembly protein CpaB [Alcanivorax sp.]|nr:Flp pilus assembly protein CpaB [Alcanivorax sp.]